MEQVTLNLAQQVPPEVSGNLARLQRGMAAGAITGMDAFALIFQQMAEGMGEGLNGDPAVILGGQGQQKQKNDNTEDTTLGMQELAALLLQQPEFQPDIVEATPEQLETLCATMEQVQWQGTAVTQPVQSALATAEGQTAATINGAALIGAENLEGMTAKGNRPISADQKTTATDTDKPQVYAAELAEVEQTIERPVVRTRAGEQALFDGQNQFKSAVEEAKKQLSGKKAIDNTEVNPAVATETLSPKPTTLNAPLQKVERMGQDAELTKQIDVGVKENLALGKREFTMKLKPEALGEITVKLVEKAGKTVLTISTANAQTAKLINNDLAALREAVKPMAVEVHEAVSQSSDSAQAQMQQFNMSGQQFAQQQQRNSHGSHQMTGAYYGEEGELETLDSTEQVLETSGLDTYI